jgi:hypothetical protein
MYNENGSSPTVLGRRRSLTGGRGRIG